MKNFDINRFGRTMVWNIKSSKSEYMTIVVTLFSAFITIPLLAMLFNIGNPTVVLQASMQTVGNLNSFILAVFCAASGCWMFNNMKNKAQRISFKMLPATDLEKFLTRFIYVTVFFIVGAFVAYMLADVVRMLICLLFYGDTLGSNIPLLFKGVSSEVSINGSTYKLSMFVLAISFIIFTNAFAVLGGTFFRRRQVILTFLTGILIEVLAIAALVKLHDYCNFYISNDHNTFAVWLFALFFIILAAVMYWLSYRLFRRMQVINNKWINV